MVVIQILGICIFSWCFLLEQKILGEYSKLWKLWTVLMVSLICDKWQKDQTGYSDVEEKTALGTSPTELAVPQMESFTEG